MRNHGVRLLLVALIGICCLALHPNNAEAAPLQTGAMENQLRSDVNFDRANYHAAPLKEDATLDAIAHARAWYILTHHSVTHCSTDTLQEGCHLQVLDQFSWRNIPMDGKWAGENLGAADYPASDVSDMNGYFMASPPHEENILNSHFTKLGVGILCCFEGHIGSTQIGPNQPFPVYVEVFSS